MLRRYSRYYFVGIALLMVTGCGGRLNQPTGGTGTPVTVSSKVTVSEASSTPFYVDKTVQLNAMMSNADGSVAVTSAATWSTSNSSIATVNAAGLVTGVSPGTATISATADGVTGAATVTVATPTILSLSINPASVNLSSGDTRQYAATATYADGSTGDISNAVTWRAIPASTVTISGKGLLMAVSPGTFTVSASMALISNTAAGVVIPPPMTGLTLSPQTQDLSVGQTLKYTATASFADNTLGDVSNTVAWSVSPEGIATISADGLLTALAPGAFTVTAIDNTFDANATGNAQAVEGASLLATGRILNQATFGPTVADYLHVEQVGVKAYVQEQLSVPAYQMPLDIPASQWTGDCTLMNCAPEAWWWKNVLFGQDQLRERVAFALSKLFVVSYNEVDARYFPYYLNLLSKDAFGNWLDLMQDVSLSGAMGTYLNAANSQAPVSGSHADENFGRELMQLFSIGTTALNQDGSAQLDESGNPIPNYTSANVQSFARAFTGFTFANDDCSAPLSPRTYWVVRPPGIKCPMTAIDSLHDKASKTLLRGVVLPANQSAVADFLAALQNVFEDPSLPPFVCRRLIQNLVTSNPSPSYISRIAGVFIDNGSGVRGDMKAVISAILLDPEARAYDAVTAVPSANAGLMRDPILWWTSVLRSLNAQSTMPDPYNSVYTNIIDLWLSGQGEVSHAAPSVFSFYSPNNTINGGSIFAPEFQLENQISIVEMMRHAQDILDNDYNINLQEITIDLSPTSPLGLLLSQQGPDAMLDALDAVLMHGTMSTEMRDAILASIVRIHPTQMIQNSIYLIITSPQYRVLL